MIRYKNKAHLELKNERIEYPMIDFTKKNLKGNNVTLTVEWMVIPYTGTTTVERGATASFEVPKDYFD